jgi:phosphoribosylformimino-5-aminoimidazole carboxamide ribotide isomerase
MHGQVVQAIQGQRQHYRPIQSQLTDSHALLDVVAAILQVYPFDCVYIADLNAITRNEAYPHHRDLVRQAINMFPHLQWWVDAAIQDTAELQAWQQLGVTPVISSEGFNDIKTYLELKELAPEAVLSLDFFTEGYRGPIELLNSPTLWQEKTILMSLPKVGANLGPDIALLKSMQEKAPEQNFYAAGGARNISDIKELQQADGSGILIASALHNQQITGDQLTGLIEM